MSVVDWAAVPLGAAAGGPVGWAALVAAGVVAGAVNGMVGSGSLVSFPVLLATGLAPVTANATNTVGLVAGSVSGALGYRSELRRHRGLALRLVAWAAAGAAAGAALLLALPGAFGDVVPGLVALAAILMYLQPRLAAALRARRPASDAAVARMSPALGLAVAGAGLYGGYFGAAQGVILLAVLGIGTDLAFPATNGLKNALAGVNNAVASVIFVATGHVEWIAAVALAVGAVLGGGIGARLARRIAASAVRPVVVTVGLLSAAALAIGRL